LIDTETLRNTLRDFKKLGKLNDKELEQLNQLEKEGDKKMNPCSYCEFGLFSDISPEEISDGGVDVVFEHTGQQTWKESLRALKTGGKIVTCGATTGPQVKIDLRA